MQTLEFLKAVLGSNGRYCLWAKKFIDNVAVQGSIEQSYHESIEDLAEVAKKKSDRGYDTYFAVGCIGEANNRKANNIVSLKALFLDIDAGPTKEYPTQREAFQALRKFTKAVGMPKPFIVSSGYGLHVYWLLSKSVPREEWLQAAALLKEQCKAHGLLVDHQCTMDAARILRVVGTFNQKWTTANKLVEVLTREEPAYHDLQDLKGILMGGMETMPVISDTARQLIPNNLIDHYTRNVSCKFERIVKHEQPCAQVINRLRTRADASYDEWTQMLALANKCDDREKAIDIISRGHPDYDYATAEAKAATFDGPTLCSSFETVTPGFCVGCPHQGKIKSPIILGKEINTVDEPVVVKVEGEYLQKDKEITIPKYPRGYTRGQNGGVYQRIQDEDGGVDLKVIYQHDLYVHSVLKSEREYTAIIRVHFPHDGMREFIVKLEQLSSREELRKVLSRNGIVQVDMQKIMVYLMDWVNELQVTNSATEANEQFGWSDDKKSFVWGDWIYRQGEQPVPNVATTPTAGYMAEIRPKGKESVVRKWINQFKGEGHEVAQSILFYTLAAPLMAFTGINSSSTNFSSAKSGIGKTSMTYVGLSLWGRPKGISLTADDSHNSRAYAAQVLRNAPILVDEMTNQPPKKLSEIIYAMSNGQQRNRMKSSSNELRHRGKEWFTTFVYTANDSLVDVLHTYRAEADAESQRMCEIFVRPEDSGLDQETARSLMADLDENYGHLIPDYLQYLVDHSNELADQVDRYRSELERLAGLTGPNRFWSAGWGSALLAGVISKKLGIHDYDLNRVRTYIVDKLKLAKARLEKNKETQDAASVLGRFWNDNISNIVVVESSADKRGQNGHLDVHTLPLVSPRGKLVARYEPDTNFVFISTGALRKWCAEEGNKLSFTDLKSKIETELNGKYMAKCSLGKGTNYAVSQVSVFKIDAVAAGLGRESEEDRADSA